MLTAAIKEATRSATAKAYTCSQCPKVFVTRSNLKRHMENPNIHNIPYTRCRDQKRWKGHSKKIISKEETTERMRKWRAENREKNRQNDLRCRVYRLARQRYGDEDSADKQAFIKDEIDRRLGRRLILDDTPSKSTNRCIQRSNNQQHQQAAASMHSTSTVTFSWPTTDQMDINHISNASGMVVNEELPFYSAPQQKIELPSIGTMSHSTLRHNHYLQTLQQQQQQQQQSSSSSRSFTASPTMIPDLSPDLPSESVDIFLQKRTSNSTYASLSGSNESCSGMMTPTPTFTPHQQEHDQGGHAHELLLSPLLSTTSASTAGEEDFGCVLPSMHKLLSPSSSAASAADKTFSLANPASSQPIHHNKNPNNNSNTNILDEFVGVVLDYIDSTTTSSSEL